MSVTPAFVAPVHSTNALGDGRVDSRYPDVSGILLALSSAALLVLSFPNFDLWFLAWIALAPLLISLAKTRNERAAFVIGWLWGCVFFYGTCYWLTYSLIRYGHIRPWLAYSLLVLPVAIVSVFPALSCLVLLRLLRRWGNVALLAAPFIWVAFEWARLGVTGQLWNAIGYSQAYVPILIQSARWGGVYAVGFMIVVGNTAIAYLFIERNPRALAIATILLVMVVVLTIVPGLDLRRSSSVSLTRPDVLVIAIQPNVPMDPVTEPSVSQSLLEQHQKASVAALQNWDRNGQVDNAAGAIKIDEPSEAAVASRQAIPRLVIWPESPMNFAYGNDSQLRIVLAQLARTNHTSLLFNSLEAAPQNGSYNSALLVNEEGSLVAQYDKIRLMPFGEYVPLPSWMPGSGTIAPLVGGFVAGTKYPLLPVGQKRAGVFICFESAFPDVARELTNAGAGMLVNISNDGYLGPTPVMRQHLANAIFRAVENDRPVLRVTNTGLTAYIAGNGELKDVGPGFQPAARVWGVRGVASQTFYAQYGELFVALCALITVIALAIAEMTALRARRLKQRA
jgi:apolipoprotein N-acyltransferase